MLKRTFVFETDKMKTFSSYNEHTILIKSEIIHIHMRENPQKVLQIMFEFNTSLNNYINKTLILVGNRHTLL